MQCSQTAGYQAGLTSRMTPSLRPYTPTPASKLTASVSPRHTRSYSTAIRSRPRSSPLSRPSSRASLLAPRPSLRSINHHARPLIRLASTVSPTASSSSSPPKSAPLPPWNQPSADLRPREVPWLFRTAWKLLKAYLLLLLIYAFIVIYGNKDYIMQEILKMGTESKINEYRAPAGTKEVKLEDVKGVDEAKEVRAICLDPTSSTERRLTQSRSNFAGVARVRRVP